MLKEWAIRANMVLLTVRHVVAPGWSERKPGACLVLLDIRRAGRLIRYRQLHVLIEANALGCLSRQISTDLNIV